MLTGKSEDVLVNVNTNLLSLIHLAFAIYSCFEPPK